MYLFAFLYFHIGTHAKKGTQKVHPKSPPDGTGRDIQPDFGKELYSTSVLR